MIHTHNGFDEHNAPINLHVESAHRRLTDGDLDPSPLLHGRLQ